MVFVSLLYPVSMTPREMKKLGEKVASDSTTPSERLLFVRELNVAIKGIRDVLQEKSKSNQK